MIPVALLVVAKAPVPGLAKTRLAASIGDDAAADVAAAALLDTLDAVAAAPVAARIVALTGDLAAASRGAEIQTRLDDFTVIGQRGAEFADRLANAHADAAVAAGGFPVLQIGMDTPQVTADLLADCATTLCGVGAVLGMARDGGWWALGVTEPAMAECLRDVPMSTRDTGAVTLRALRDTGVDVRLISELADVDTIDDVAVVSRVCLPGSRFKQLTVAEGA
jgi:glycosyltransferase A (GT-A) superfamily protein (DUF2064 family)